MKHVQVAESLYAALHPLYPGVNNHLKCMEGGKIKPHIICPEASNSPHYSVNQKHRTRLKEFLSRMATLLLSWMVPNCTRKHHLPYSWEHAHAAPRVEGQGRFQPSRSISAIQRLAHKSGWALAAVSQTEHRDPCLSLFITHCVLLKASAFLLCFGTAVRNRIG